MSERWKYQIKSGSFFGLILTIASSLFKALDIGFVAEYVSLQFLLKLIVYILVGIFFVGYFNWKAKIKKDSEK